MSKDDAQGKLTENLNEIDDDYYDPDDRFWDDEERREWQEYNAKLDRISGHFPTDSDPEIAKEVWEYLEGHDYGWKLHLNFDPSNDELIEHIGKYLSNMERSEKISAFKIGLGYAGYDYEKNRETFKVGPPGKQATIYIGPKDKAREVAQAIEQDLGDILMLPEGFTLTDDTPFTRKVMARFYITGWDKDFYYYGPIGSSILFKDAFEEDLATRDGWDRTRQPSKEAVERAEHLLRERYGTYYTGTEELAPLA